MVRGDEAEALVEAQGIVAAAVRGQLHHHAATGTRALDGPLQQRRSGSGRGDGPDLGAAVFDRGPPPLREALKLADEDLYGYYIAEDIVNTETGEIYAEAGQELDKKLIDFLIENKYTEVPVLDIDHVSVGSYIRNTLVVDKNMTREDALFDICDKHGNIVKTGDIIGPETRVRITDLDGEDYYLMVLDGEVSTVKPFQLRRVA